MKKSRYNTARRLLIFWTLFIGTGALAGGVGMLVDPTGKAMGMDAMLPFFKKLPFADILFKDFLFSGFALFCVNGITNVTAAYLLIKKKKSGIIAGGIFGITLMLWICIQFYIFPPNFMSATYFIFGFLQAVTGYAACVFYKQENFVFDADKYKNIGTDPSKLVVYFSRMGYTKTLAYKEANRLGADVFEITTNEKTDGTAGFWNCGRIMVSGGNMQINDGCDTENYEEVIICSPVWVFTVAAPIKAFCKNKKGRIKSHSIILCHYMNAKFKKAADKIDGLIGNRRRSFKSVPCKEGKFSIVYKESL